MSGVSTIRLSFWLLLSWCVGGAWAGGTARTPHVELTLLSEQARITGGQTFWVGLQFDLLPHWHIYWRNPGDSGEPPRVSWRLPQGWSAGDIRWPVPRRIPVGPLVNYGYEDSVMLLVPITADRPDAPAGRARISAEVSWLVCREECIPERAELDIDLAWSGDPAKAAGQVQRFEVARSRWPLPLPGRAHYRADPGQPLQLRLDGTGWPAERIDTLWFASNDWGPVAASAAQTWRPEGDGLAMSLPPGEAPLSPGQTLRGLLVVSERTADGPVTRGFEIVAEPPAAAVPTAGTTLAFALGLALVGGLLLNLMPCVLPVLSIKVLGLLQHAGRHSARHGLVFLAGVLLTFAGLAALLIALRSGGAALGWGFQLQEPLVTVGLMYLMLAVALNLSGVYTLGAGMMGLGQRMADGRGLRGTFGSGVLAVIVASPCTAPFMGSALGFALTRPAPEALLVFLALGLGFALPVLVLSSWPRWLRRLPAPGPWMERLRNGLAFPMYATAAWLLWVLSQQASPGTLGAALAGAVLLAFAMWWYGQPLRHHGRRLAVTLTLLAAGLAVATVAAVHDARQDVAGDQAWSAERLRALQREGRPVLVNFTAAWCITCKVNERVALGTDRVRAALDRRGIVYLKGDWTRRDAAIARELERHGRSGVPLYLLYPPGGDLPRILPQVLTEGLVLQAINDIDTQE